MGGTYTTYTYARRHMTGQRLLVALLCCLLFSYASYYAYNHADVAMKMIKDRPSLSIPFKDGSDPPGQDPGWWGGDSQPAQPAPKPPTPEEKGKEKPKEKPAEKPKEKDKDGKEQELVYITDEDQVLLLESRRHINRTFNRVDGLGIDKQMFNPALLELPRGGKYQFLVIARVNHVETEIDGRKYRLAKQVAFFADLHTDAAGVVSIRRESSARTILDGEFALPAEHPCASEHSKKYHVDLYIGPEDTRLFWTASGAPLLQFTSQANGEGECQGIYIMDARAAIPELVDAFGDLAAQLPPVEIDRPQHVRRPRPFPTVDDPAPDMNMYEREKNWAPFMHAPVVDPVDSVTKPDDLLFHVSIEGQRVYKYQPHVAEVVPVYEPDRVETQTCFDDKMHHATPLLSLTLCARGTCAPSVHNTVFVGIIQKMRATPWYKWYQAHVVTWNATEPFAYRGVSKRITYAGMKEKKYAWTCGLVYQWNTTTLPRRRDHGFLDDWMLITFGTSDEGAGWVSVQAEDLLKDHMPCGAHDGS